MLKHISGSKMGKTDRLSRRPDWEVGVEKDNECNKTAGELEHPWWRIILFLFHFPLLCNSLKCAGHYDSKGVCRIIQVDKY